MKPNTIFFFLTLLPTLSHAFKNCGFGTPDFPAPKDLASSPTIQKALSHLKSAIEDGITIGNFSPNSTSFSVEFFSTQSQTSLFQYHHTAPNLAISNSTKIVDSNSIYRIGSLSKLLAVYTFLVEAGESHFHEPVTKYIPELAVASHEYSSDNAADFVDWEEVTVGEIASHMSGIGRESVLDMLGTTQPSELAAFGLPPLNSSDFIVCTQPLDCPRKEFFQNIIKQRHPVFPTSTTPTYSNVAFQLLGYVLESITGKGFEKSFNDSLVSKLKLNGTSYTLPKDGERSVIPTAAFETFWSLELLDFTPAGGMYSNSGDLSQIGRSILSSAILSPAQTRRWMKPITHGATLQFSVGMPWEIGRLQLPAPQNKIVDIYQKDGDIGSYHAKVGLVPGWDIGYAVLHADDPTQTTTVTTAISELVNKIVFPAIEVAAREQATANYAGTYKSANPNLNSSLTVTTNPDTLGLSLTSFISNGTDMFTTIPEVLPGKFPASNLLITLYPTGLANLIPGSYGDKQQAFRAVFENAAVPADDGSAFGNCLAWVNVDSPFYGGVALDEVVFVVGRDGKAKSAEARTLGAVLDRV